VVVSAHWIDDPVGITTGGRLKTIHDFSGFPKQLYEVGYPAKGDDTLSQKISRLLSGVNIENRLVKERGLDHGAWMPLKLIYPEAQFPVIQISLPAVTVKDLLLFGEALGQLREEGTLIIGSGSSVHNLRLMNLQNRTDPRAVEFEDWLREAVEQNHFDWLVNREIYPPNFQRAHPTLEHYTPLIIAWSAAGVTTPGVRIHYSFDYGNIGMSMFAFGGEGN
jgi:4,5-DOPA dioxygenase extradiol